MAIPTAGEIRQYLRGYCVDLEGTFSVNLSTTVGSAIVTGDTRNIEPMMRVSGAGIPVNATVQSVESIGITGQFTLSANATATGADVALTFTYYTEMTDHWIAQRRDRRIIPHIERVTGQTISAVSTFEEYLSGNGGSILMLSRRPVIELVNLTYTNIPAETQTGNLLLSVELVQEEGILKSKANFNEGSFDPVFPNGVYNIKARYTYGYADTPPDLCEAVLIMTAKRVLVQIGARTGGGDLNTEGYNRTFGDRGKYTDVLNLMDQDAYDLLRPYKTAVVGA